MPRVDLNAARARSSALFAGFTSGQKTMLGLAAAATVVGGLLFMRMSSTTQLAPLYSNLPADSAADVTGALDAAGVRYQLGGNGSTIMVPRDQVHQVRLDLAASGLPRDGAPGYDLLDQQGLTTSQFQQHVGYQRAMEGELSRTIRAINGVDNAIVHLVMPESDLFSGDEQHPSASVLVETAPNRPLSGMQVQAIVHLVASSVEGLVTEHVTVADNSGRVLSAAGSDGSVATAGDMRASQTAAFEAALAADIEHLLLPVAGQGRVRVNVNSVLDFDQRETTTEAFGDPGTAPIVEQRTATETFEGTGGANTAQGVLGPDGLPIDAATSESNYESRNESVVFANDKTTTRSVNAPGDVQRLAIGVVLDEAAGVDVRAIEQLIERSTGFDAERGDTLEVTQLPFDTSTAEAAQAELDAMAAAEQRNQLFSLLRTVAAVLIVAVVLFLAWRSHRKAVARFPLAIPLPSADPDGRGLPAAGHSGRGGRVANVDGAGTDGELEPGGAYALGTEPHLDALTAGPSEADAQREELQGQISDMIDRQADDVAQVLRAWMAER